MSFFPPVISLSDTNWTSVKITVPDGVTALGAVALVMSDNLGLGFTPVPLKVTKYSLCAIVSSGYFSIVGNFPTIVLFSFSNCCCAFVSAEQEIQEEIFASSFQFLLLGPDGLFFFLPKLLKIDLCPPVYRWVCPKISPCPWMSRRTSSGERRLCSRSTSSTI